MLQRIQTVYMLASVIAALMLFLFPLAVFETPQAIFELTAFGLSSVTPEVSLDAMQWPLLIVLLIMLVLPLVAIFMYKNHKRQLRLLIFTAVLDVLFYGLFYFFEVGACEDLIFSVIEKRELSSSMGFIPLVMPALSIFGCIMAIRGVLYDMALLASADRLRPSRK